MSTGTLCTLQNYSQQQVIFPPWLSVDLLLLILLTGIRTMYVAQPAAASSKAPLLPASASNDGPMVCVALHGHHYVTSRLICLTIMHVCLVVMHAGSAKEESWI